MNSPTAGYFTIGEDAYHSYLEAQRRIKQWAKESLNPEHKTKEKEIRYGLWWTEENEDVA